MIRRIPLLATLVVLIAAGIMIRLGFWQLERLQQKQDMIARFTAAQASQVAVVWPGSDPSAMPPPPYHRVVTTCARPTAIAPQSGQNAQGRAGWVQVATCAVAPGRTARVVLGWSARPAPVSWSGGAVRGTFLVKGGDVIVADPPLAGLAANARPDPRALPNNHLAYAVQWFAFAAVALVIYALAVRKRLSAA